MKTAAAPSLSIAEDSRRLRVFIVDDHPVFRQGIKYVLSEQPNLTVVGEAPSAQAALQGFRALRPDVVLVDVSMPGPNGIELIKMMLAEDPSVRVLVISMHDESIFGIRALRAGARGYMMKSEASECIPEALRRIVAGKLYVSPTLGERLVFKAIQSVENGLGSPVDVLSDREVEVLEKLGRGLGTREIADELHLSPKTVETHRAHIKEKLQLRDSAAVARFAIEWLLHRELGG